MQNRLTAGQLRKLVAFLERVENDPAVFRALLRAGLYVEFSRLTALFRANIDRLQDGLLRRRHS